MKNDARIERMLESYLVINRMKAQMEGVDSVAGHRFGAIMLAVAMNSERDGKVAELAEVLRGLLAETPDGFAGECLDLEFRIMEVIDLFAEDLTEEGAFAGLCDKGVFSGSQEEQTVFGFYFKNRNLRRLIRTGWTRDYWNVSAPRVERISDHVVGTIGLALALDAHFGPVAEIDRIIRLLAIHEVGENLIGDFTPYDISRDEKLAMEHKAMAEVVGGLRASEEMLSDLAAFDDGSSEWARFAHGCDKLEADIQAKIYEDQGLMPPLSEQGENRAINSPRGQEVLKKISPQRPFDVWYEADYGLYADLPLHAEVLEYIRTHEIK